MSGDLPGALDQARRVLTEEADALHALAERLDESFARAAASCATAPGALS
jgi:hypothetical protein